MPGAEIVAAADVATGGMRQENYEGVLVRIENATVTGVADDHGVWEVDGALKVEGLFFTDDTWLRPAVDTAYASITGVMTYTFEEAKLAPTALADLVEG